MVLLSLCVPIYGVEKEIPRFLMSLEKNLHPNIEVLLIDDGAKDKSGEIADAFAEKHADCVRIVHKPNGGLSSARNKGLELAKGEYVIFPDPDDYLAEDYVSSILDAINKYDAPDMIFFDYKKGYDLNSAKRSMKAPFQEGVVSKEAFIREYIKDRAIRSYVWNKAIKRSFYEGRLFDSQIRIGEDYALLTDMVMEMERFAYLPKALYCYMVRETSLVHTGKIADDIKFYDLALDRYHKFSKLYSRISKCGLIESVCIVLKRIYTQDTGVDAEPYERIIKDNIKDILTQKEYSVDQKKRALFVWLGIAEAYYRRKRKKNR